MNTNKIQTKLANTYWVKIYLAGNLDIAKQVCREECRRKGLCVTIRPCTYIYTCGEEEGVEIQLINYPRFPAVTDTELNDIYHRARGLAILLMGRLCQRKVLIMDPKTTEWIADEKFKS